MKHVLAALVLAPALWPTTVHALTTRCVGTAQELRDALSLTFNNDDVQIRIKAGVYSTGGAAFEASLAADKDLEISGGWTGACDAQLTTPTATVLDGGDASLVMQLSQFNNSTAPTAHLWNFTFANGNANFGSAGGLAVNLLQGTPEIHMDRLRFVSNTNTGPGGALHIRQFTGGVATLRNSLLTNNAGSNGGGVLVTSNNADSYTLLVNNTIADNQAINANSAAGGVSIGFSDPSVGIIELCNNAIVSNTRGAAVASDVFAYPGSAGVESMSNAYSVAPTGFVTDTGSLLGDPQLVGNGDHRLSVNSPLIDAGLALPGDEIGPRDFFYNDRISGAAVDIGAHEFTAQVFANGFE